MKSLSAKNSPHPLWHWIRKLGFVDGLAESKASSLQIGQYSGRRIGFPIVELIIDGSFQSFLYQKHYGNEFL